MALSKLGFKPYGTHRYLCQGAMAIALLGCSETPKEDTAETNQTRAAQTSTSANGCGDNLPANTKASVIHIIAFGDSLYAGYQLGPCEGLVPQLQKALRQKGRAVTVQNAGVSGDTTAGGKARLSFVLDNAREKPQLVLLGLGGNDMLRGINPEQTRINLTAMLEELKKRDIPVILTGMVAAPNLGADYARAFNPIYPELAKAYNAPLYPFILDGVLTNKALMLGDNVHPNAKGIMKIVDQLAPLVEGNLPNADVTP